MKDFEINPIKAFFVLALVFSSFIIAIITEGVLYLLGYILAILVGMYLFRDKERKK